MIASIVSSSGSRHLRSNSGPAEGTKLLFGQCRERSAACTIGPMTERTAPGPGAIACPFVAFESDRDERSDRPDHRHRCYAEVRPAPRAAAHQETFCLSPGFAACPSFQDWARREAARARVAAASSAAEDLAGLVRGSTNRPAQSGIDADRSAGDDEDVEPAGDADRDATDTGLAAWTGQPSDAGPDASEPPIRNPQRDWAAPPPWVVPSGRSSDEPALPGFLAPRRRGAPGDAPETEAAGLAGSRWLRDVLPGETLGGEILDPLQEPPADDDLERSLAEDRAARERVAGPQVNRAAAAVLADAAAAAAGTVPAAGGARPARRSASLPTRPSLSDVPRRPIERDTAGPAWERPQRNEAFPTLKTRMRLPSLSRLTLATLALVVAAIVLFSAPFILKLAGGGGGDATATPSPTPAPTVSLPPTGPPPPTAKVYVVVAKDTISTIAKKFGLTIEELLAANKQVKNPDKIAIGDELTIPIAAPSEIISGASPSP
jgi:nucleoid-associated protein YgaU